MDTGLSSLPLSDTAPVLTETFRCEHDKRQPNDGKGRQVHDVERFAIDKDAQDERSCGDYVV